MCGDFIALRNMEERCSVWGTVASLDGSSFKNFINNILIDFPLCGRRYTWFKGDGLSMSRLD